MWREALGIAMASVALAPAVVAAKLVDAIAGDATDALAQLGITDDITATARLTGGRSSAVYRVECVTRTLVVKRALAGGSVLAFGARLAGPQPYPGDLSPRARIAREARALARLAAAGVRVPALVAAKPEANVLAVAHVDGEALPARLARPGGELALIAYARALRAVHAAGLVLSDAHPGNALVAGTAVTLIDFEFAELAAEVADPAGRRAFDIAYAAAYLTAGERRTFLRELGGNHRIATVTEKLAGFAPLFAFEAARQRRAA